MTSRTNAASSTLPKDAEPNDVREKFDNFAEFYDKELTHTTYPALLSLIETFVDVVGRGNSAVKILDLGAGTGLAAVELKKHGFTNIDAIDVSQGMLDKAREKNVYKNYICEAVTDKRLDIPTGTYDSIISGGTISSGYVKPSAFNEILRLVKPGGYICFTIRQDVYDDTEYGYAKKFQELVDSRRWMEVRNYMTDYIKGYLDIQKKCSILCYKVLKND